MPYFEEASLITVVVANVVGAVRFKRLDTGLRYLAILVFFGAFIEVLSRVAGAWQGSNLFLLPIDTMVEFGLLAYLYRQALRPMAVGRWLPGVVAAFSLASLLAYVEPDHLVRFNTVQRLAESLLVLGLVLLYFYKVIHDLVIIHLEREPMFWISVGLLLYFSGNVFIFVSSNYVIQHSTALSMKLWNIHALLYMVLYGLYTWALWISPSNRK
jgi:hypothetical protein